MDSKTVSKKKIKFVTDSTCDIPTELLQKWDITVVPCFVNFGGGSYADDGVDLIREDFYAQLPNLNPFPTTAAPPPALAGDMIKSAFEGADHLVILCVPANLSAVYNSMRLGMADLPPDRVTLIDSRQLSLGTGFQVLVGAEVAQETGDVEKVLDAINRVRANEHVYAAVATMEYLRRSGRVSNVVASVGQLLQIRPVISVEDGEVLTAARVRTFKNATEKLIELVRAAAPLDKLALLHADNADGVQRLLESLKDIAPPDTIITEVTPTIGTHLGIGSLGAATLNKNWRQ